MTREEAIRELIAMKPHIEADMSVMGEVAYDLAIEALKQPEQKWVLCSERLPEDDVEVFIYLFERSAPYIAWVEDCQWYTEDFEVKKENYPTAWMPLPESYSGE